MKAAPRRLTITAALPYTNGPIHIGHLAGVYIPADIYARFQRIEGNDVAFICGSDEHGVAISMKARKEQTTPQQIIDTYDAIIRESFTDFGISFDNYSRTSRAIHHQTARDFFTTLHEKGAFEEQTNQQLYDAQAQQFLADRFVVGTCPRCAHKEAYGDQCEKCGASLNATDLIDPISTLSGSVPERRETTHWYLPLDRNEAFLKSWILEEHKGDWKPNVYGQCKSWIDEGLKPRAVTRDLDWGIDVPLEQAKGKKLYVWFEAPIGYISSTIEWAKNKGINWEPYWKDSATELVHFIGKDNIVFHCIIFPAMLKEHGAFILPKNVPANEFLNLEGQKLSTSKNWAVWLHEYLQDFEDMQDALRYVLTINAPETKDNDFTWSDFQSRVNNELVAVLGNFVNRVTVLTQKHFQGIVPAPGKLSDEDQAILHHLTQIPAQISQSLEHFKFREAAQHYMGLARIGNKYLADQEPWKLIKTQPERVPTILFVALQLAAALAHLGAPLLPHSSKKLKAMLNLEHQTQSFTALALAQNLLQPGHQIAEPQLLFRKIEDQEIEQQLNKLRASAERNKLPLEPKTYEPVKDLIDFEQFSTLDLRVGSIISAEKMPKADKLLILQVDLGFEKRTIVSGIAEYFDPEKIIGQQVSVVVNLAPRTLRGVESQGMILMATKFDGSLEFVAPQHPSENGSLIS
jgi:methionyl-tRNA synthetase